MNNQVIEWLTYSQGGYQVAKPKIVSLLPPMPVPLSERLEIAIDISSVELVELNKKSATEEEICETCEGAAIIIGDYSAENYISKRVLEAAKGVRHIQFGSKGFDGVDLRAATEMGVTVSNGFGDGVNVAEHTLMLILSLLRHTVRAHTSMERGEWRQWEIIRETRPLRGMTLGILGLGTIGREVAKRTKPFEVKVIYHKRSRLSGEEENSLSMEYRDFDDLLRESDILSLHLPLVDETRGLIGRPEIALMKEGAILINTARGELVDEDALAEALEGGRLWGAAVDYEPLSLDSPLRKLDNVLLMPHCAVGGGTPKSEKDEALKFAQNIARILEGEKPLNIVNGL
jgi:lactate dehydrogenase-like 2-hydroxyacid dehydrogenase